MENTHSQTLDEGLLPKGVDIYVTLFAPLQTVRDRWRGWGVGGGCCIDRRDRAEERARTFCIAWRTNKPLDTLHKPLDTIHKKTEPLFSEIITSLKMNNFHTNTHTIIFSLCRSKISMVEAYC